MTPEDSARLALRVTRDTEPHARHAKAVGGGEGETMTCTWSITDDNAPRTLDEIEACRAYQLAGDDGSTFAACKCGAESRGGRACLACCDAMADELSKKGYDDFPATRDETETPT